DEENICFPKCKITELLAVQQPTSWHHQPEALQINQTRRDDAWVRVQRTELNESVAGGGSPWRCKRPSQKYTHVGTRWT
ncbi:hypothetical protein AVEN_70905-1, partial [Araneus ventricosus]